MRKFIWTMIFLVLVNTILVGCNHPVETTEDIEGPVHAVLVLAPNPNTPVLNTEAAAGVIERVCSQGDSSIAIVVADGKPYVFDEITAPEIDRNLSVKMRRKIIEKRVREIENYVSQALSVTPHADYMGALELASRILRSYEDDYEKHIVVLGSMLSDVAPLDLSKEALDVLDIQQSLKQLIESRNIPNFKLCNITVYNAGDTVGPIQKDLTNSEREILIDLWTSIFISGNALSVEFSSAIPTGLAYEGLPEVNPVPVVDEINLKKKKKIKETDAVILGEKAVSFEPGTAVLADEKVASEAITELVTYMNENPKTKALLVGTTACWGEEEPQIRLSFDRGQAVKKLFVEAGINKNRLQVIGTGWHSCFYKDDQKTGGDLDDALAPRNRTTIWIQQKTELAKKVLGDKDADKFLME